MAQSKVFAVGKLYGSAALFVSGIVGPRVVSRLTAFLRTPSWRWPHDEENMARKYESILDNGSAKRRS
jgi:hypothetical protein